ncbi:hypothetical protein KFU94_06170 [Chloroflexi bacterium TSY]|nr:hypothetical protein [Chloroflexi bacterium TSY]
MKNRAITVSGRQAKRAKPAPVHQGEFVDLVKQALRRFHDPEWLSRNSPLATPYLLGRRLLEMPAPLLSGKGLSDKGQTERGGKKESTLKKRDKM